MPTDLPQAATDPDVQRALERAFARALRVCFLGSNSNDRVWAARISSYAAEAPVILGHATLVVSTPAA
jgi:hypothetical protein